MREHTLFNIEQTNGLKKFQVGFSKPKATTFERYENVNAVIDSTDARIEYGGNQPCYRPHDDMICTPFFRQYENLGQQTTKHL